MRASNETYRKVAENCSAYERVAAADSVTNGCGTDTISCLTCRHFDNDKYCRLDLYDKIVKNHELG